MCDLIDWMRWREDLPEMRWQLALIVMAASAGTGFVGTLLANTSFPGSIWSIPVFLFSAALYSMVILLWRKPAVFLVTVLTAVSILMAGIGVGWCAAVSLSLLFLACLYAVSLLAGESRFVQTTSLAAGIAAVLGIGGLIGFGLKFGSAESLYAVLTEEIAALLEMAAASGTMQFTADAPEGMARSILLSAPALVGIGAELLAALLIWMGRNCLQFFACQSYFRRKETGITTPKSFGAVLLVFLAFTLCTPADAHPMLNSILSNVLFVLAFPCAYVGLTESIDRIRRRFCSALLLFREREDDSPSPISALLVAVFLVLLVGFSSALLLAAFLGAVYILRSRRPGESS